MNSRIHALAAAVALMGLAAPAAAKVSAEEAAKLGNELTPIGAEKAGNAEGTIPAWTPTTKSDSTSEYSSDPVLDKQEPLFTITADNMAEHRDKLTIGHQELMKRYPDTYKTVSYTHLTLPTIYSV